jgi:hypothetical protein
VFRRDGPVFRCRADAIGWTEGSTGGLDPDDPLLSCAQGGRPFPIQPDDAQRLGLPIGLASPTVAVPIADRLGCHALALYGPHATGADLSHDERAMLARLAEAAALAYRHIEADILRRQLAALRMQSADLPYETSKTAPEETVPSKTGKPNDDVPGSAREGLQPG